MALAAVSPTLAGTRDGNFMVRVQGTVIDPDASAKVYAGNNRLEGTNADVSTEVVPTMTLTYFFNKTSRWSSCAVLRSWKPRAKGLLIRLT
jgi:OmpW family.